MAETTALFQPPPPYKDEYDITYMHGIAPLTHCVPHTNPLDENAVSHLALTDQHRQHMRRLYDLMQLMLLRQNRQLAERCFSLLLRSQDWRPQELWKLGLQVACMGQERDTALRYLLRVSRTRTTLRPYTIVFLIRELILAGQYQRAHEELTSIIGAYPYRHQPQLHTYLGLLTLYLGNVDEAECRDSDSSSSIPHVPMRLAKQVPHYVQRSARLHFENAIKVAPRYMAKQTAICEHRLRQQNIRLNRLRQQAKQHHQRLCKKMRQYGWVFQDDALENPSMQGLSTQDIISQEEEVRTDNTASNLFASNTEIRTTLPMSDYFGLDSDHHFQSDESDEDDPSHLNAIREASEGPSLPQGIGDTRDATPPVMSSESETEHSSPTAAETHDSLNLALPVVQWSVHVARTYLSMVRMLYYHGLKLTYSFVLY